MRDRTALLVLSALAALAAGTACRSLDPVVVHVPMPGVSPFPPGSFDEIVVTEFRNDAAPADFDPGRALQTYLLDELRRAFRGQVLSGPGPGTPGPSPSFWKEAAAGHGRVVFLTGSVRLSCDLRKALKGRKLPFEGPFEPAKHAIIEKLRWTFVVDLTVVSGESGEPVYERSFLEERDYTDLEKPADFAFSDMSATFRDRLFPALLGSPELEKRTLLRR
jgi:hypothetical protein